MTYRHWFKLGADAAAREFGTTHGTPKPPATWSQQWQGDDVARVKKSVTIPSMKQVSLRGTDSQRSS